MFSLITTGLLSEPLFAKVDNKVGNWIIHRYIFKTLPLTSKNENLDLTSLVPLLFSSVFQVFQASIWKVCSLRLCPKLYQMFPVPLLFSFTYQKYQICFTFTSRDFCHLEKVYPAGFYFIFSSSIWFWWIHFHGLSLKLNFSLLCLLTNSTIDVSDLTCFASLRQYYAYYWNSSMHSLSLTLGRLMLLLESLLIFYLNV